MKTTRDIPPGYVKRPDGEYEKPKTARQHSAYKVGELTLGGESEMERGSSNIPPQNPPVIHHTIPGDLSLASGNSIKAGHAAEFTITPSTDEQKLNKTERAYLVYLRGLTPAPMWLGIQCLTLKLGDDCRYTPDFIALDSQGTLHAREVKGFWRDDAKVKIKVAARMYPWLRFTAAMKQKGGGWLHSEVKP